MPGDVLVITPTRGRLASAVRLYDAVRSTATLDTDVLFGVDDDDRSYDEAPSWLPLVRGPRASLSGWTNRIAAEPGALRYRALASLGDDHLPVTQGWDELLLAALEDAGGGIAFGDDKAMSERLPTAPVMSAEIPRALGWMCQPSVKHQFTDNVWLKLGQAADCLIYVPAVVIEHLHHTTGKARHDQVYAESFARWAKDEWAFNRWCMRDLASDAAKVRKALGRAEGA